MLIKVEIMDFLLKKWSKKPINRSKKTNVLLKINNNDCENVEKKIKNNNVIIDNSVINTKKDIDLNLENDKNQLRDNLIDKIKQIPHYLKNEKNTVVYDGDINSPIMFIGEAPGEEENKLQKPFVGASGKLLNKMFDTIQIKREKIYITNTFFWQPENNRPPTLDELKLTMPFVEEHISIQKPKLIVTLGASAAKCLLKINDGLMKVRGTTQYITINNIEYTIFVAFHPSYILRTHKIDDYIKDFYSIKDLLIKFDIYKSIC